MPVKIRLTRMGKKKQPTYRVVVVDSRKPRDGAYIEQIGRYDPRQEPSLIEIDNAKAVDWLRKGAQPSDRARKLLEISGAWTQFRVAKGDIHTIEEAAAEPAPVGVAGHEPEIHVVGADEPVVEADQAEVPEAEVPEAAPDVSADDGESADPSASESATTDDEAEEAQA
jgi:small subunit ribosomal protein S16